MNVSEKKRKTSYYINGNKNFNNTVNLLFNVPIMSYPFVAFKVKIYGKT